MIEVRYARFNAALVSAVLINGRPRAADDDSLPVSPFDFLPGFQRDPEELEKLRERRAIKKAIAVGFTQMGGLTPEGAQEEKRKMIERLRSNGVEDAEELIREVFPEL